MPTGAKEVLEVVDDLRAYDAPLNLEQAYQLWNTVAVRERFPVRTCARPAANLRSSVRHRTRGRGHASAFRSW